MIVVDSSAIVAILFDESKSASLLKRLDAAPTRLMSAASYVETGSVLAGRRPAQPHRALAELDAMLSEIGIQLVALDVEQAHVALRARITYGRGMGHGGVLNFGDTFSYALAMIRKAPLLFVGNDFRTTDVAVAL